MAMPSEAPHTRENWTTLTVASRAFVAIVVATGALVAVVALTEISDRDTPLLIALAMLSLLTAFAKTALAVPGSASTISFCYIIDFTTLLAFGPGAATLTMAVGVWAQGTFRVRRHVHQYRTWFSMGALALTIRAVWWTYTHLGGQPRLPLRFADAVPVVSAAMIYFLVNTVMVASAVALTTKQPVVRTWVTTYAPLWRQHLFGCGIAAIAAAGVGRSSLWFIPFTIGIVGLTYEKLHVYVDGLSESLTDAMTELPNLRYLQKHAQSEIDRARRQQQPLAVVMIDVADFKTINDTYGHRAGDSALRAIAQQLQASVRSYDICARYAGDEFVVLLPGCAPDEADAKAAGLRRAVGAIPFTPTPGTSTRLDINAGVAMYPHDALTFEDLLGIADKAMFEQKRSMPSRRRNVPERRTGGAMGGDLVPAA
jgi:diguanylate cyclase (GGDEF)-like protein